MGFPMSHEAVVRYRGYLLLPQTNQSWLVRPERSPMQLLPFVWCMCLSISVWCATKPPR